MTNENELNNDPAVKPDTPSVTPKAGWSTSQGQLTAVFTIVCLVLGALGFHYTPEQFNDWADRINSIAVTIGPIIAAALTLWSYINSRGKIASNALNANAAIKIAALAPPAIQGVAGTLMEPANFAGGLGDMFGGLIGGKDWKDPERYGNLIHVAGQLGVPGIEQVDKVNQQMHPAQIITGILGMIHKKKS